MHEAEPLQVRPHELPHDGASLLRFKQRTSITGDEDDGHHAIALDHLPAHQPATAFAVLTLLYASTVVVGILGPAMDHHRVHNIAASDLVTTEASFRQCEPIPHEARAPHAGPHVGLRARRTHKHKSLVHCS